LAQAIVTLLPDRARVLDVGAGDGLLAEAIKAMRPDVEIIGIDPLVRANAGIPIQPFDGATIPFGENAFEVAIAVDVLHHTTNPDDLLREMARVSSSIIIIKDHFKHGLFSHCVLRAMDWVGNAHHGVALPYNYLTRSEWDLLWTKVGLVVVELHRRLQLYRGPLSNIANDDLHFIAVLESA
jgi:SAM-dependent methyltransferase